MVNGSSSSEEFAGSASVGQAGEPQRADEAGEARADVAPPTPEELDAREEEMKGPRKPMGPERSGIPETIPDE